MSRLDAYIAVFCFFVVSGYSIEASLEKKAEGFWKRRIKRLAPVYYICFALALLTSWNRTDYQPSWIAAALGITALYTPILERFGTPWSLTCEICYYIFAPVLRNRSFFVVALLILSFADFALSPPTSWWAHSTIDIAPKLAWLWLAGFLLFRYRHHTAAYVALIAVLGASWWFNPNYQGDGALITLVVAAVLFYIARRQWMPAKWAKIGTMLGDWSYPMYLVHMALFAVAESFWFRNPYLYLIAVIGTSAIIHIISTAKRAVKKQAGSDVTESNVAQVGAGRAG